MIEAKKVFEAFHKHRNNAIVAVQGTSGHHWNKLTTNPNRDIFLGGAMGQSTSAVFGPVSYTHLTLPTTPYV